MKYQVFLLVSGLLFFVASFSSCTEESDPILEHVVDQPVMREVSDLVNLMFKMEGDLKLIRAGLIDDSIFSRIDQYDYEAIFTADASEDLDRDSVFVINGTAYLKEIHQLSQARNKDAALITFNNAVDACVTCHLSYCPGPVARIKKLKIN